MTSFRFVVVGDRSSNNEAEFRLVLEKIKNLPVQPEVILFVGDLIFGHSPAVEFQRWKEIVSDYFPISKVLPAFGNHDSDETIFSYMFPHLPNDQLSDYQRTVYYFDVNNTRFIVLNSDRRDYNNHYTIGCEQRVWLEGLLKNNDKAHTFVLFHVPAFPIGHHYGDSLNVNQKERDALWKVLDKYGVSAVFVGHEHNYNRRLIDHSFSSKYSTFKNFIYQLTVGVSGSLPSMRVFDSKNLQAGPFGDQQYLIVDIFDDWAAFTANNIHNDQLDFFIHHSTKKHHLLQESLIKIGDSWKYLDDGSDQGDQWRNNSFNDSAWFSGLTKLGYGDGNEFTIVSYGSKENKPITTYFRKAFAIENPSDYQNIHLKVLKVDGAIVYVNGVEVFRSNMPKGPVNYKTLANAALKDYEEILFLDEMIRPNLLLQGKNIIAAEVHKWDPSSSDMGFSLELTGIKKSPESQALIPFQSEWKYWDHGPGLDKTWKYSSFNDAVWKAGPAILGYGDGDGDEATLLSYGLNPYQKHITYYFRKNFSINSPLDYESLTLKLLRDDGAVVYVNGIEVLRTNLPPGSIAYHTLANSPIYFIEDNLVIRKISPHFFKAGANVIAVEIHQTSQTSSDISFDLELVGNGRLY